MKRSKIFRNIYTKTCGNLHTLTLLAKIYECIFLKKKHIYLRSMSIYKSNGIHFKVAVTLVFTTPRSLRIKHSFGYNNIILDTNF